MNYLIDYSLLDARGLVVKSGTYKVKNKITPLHAMISLEVYLKRIYPTGEKLKVWSSKEDTGFDIDDFLKGFRGFNPKN